MQTFKYRDLFFDGMETRVLEDIGLTKGETKVYLALLDLGQSTTGDIVKKSGVSTSKVYKILDKLIEKGLASYILKRKVKHFKVADPSKILDYLEEKERTLESRKKEITELLPALKIKQKLAAIEQEAEIYEGMEGLRTVFDDIINTLEKNDTQLVFGAGAGAQENRYLSFFHLFHKRRERKGIKAKIIFNEDVRGKFKSQEESPLVKVKYLPQTTPAAINIYGNKTIIALLTEKPIAIVIKSKEITNSFRSYFEIMWQIAKL